MLPVAPSGVTACVPQDAPYLPQCFESYGRSGGTPVQPLDERRRAWALALITHGREHATTWPSCRCLCCCALVHGKLDPQTTQLSLRTTFANHLLRERLRIARALSGLRSSQDRTAARWRSLRRW